MKGLLIILLFSATMAQAQQLSQLGRFSLPYEKACAPVTISVTVEDNFGNVPRTYIYEEGLIDVTDTFHTYTTPGVYRIIQINGEDLEVKTDTLTFEVAVPLLPQFDLFKCSPTEVRVDITDTYYDYFIVKFTSSDSVVVSADDPPPTYDYTQSNGSIQVFGRFENGYPNCSDAFKTFTLTEPVDATVASANISEGCENEFYLNLITNADSLTLYQIALQQGNGNYTTVFEGKINRLQNSFPVDFDTAQPSYCVRINKLDACTSAVTAGAASCYTLDASSIRPLSESYATYRGNDIFIRIDSTTSNEIRIERKYGLTGNYDFLQNVQSSYLDRVGSHFRGFEYKLLQKDTCGNLIDSVQVAAPYLKIRDKNKRTNDIEFDLTEPVNQLTGAQQTLIIYNSDSSAATEIPYESSLTLPAQIGDQLKMVVHYSYADQAISVFSNTVTTSYETIIYIPKGFTPNGDGMNDQLELFGLPTNTYEISIYNRWGELIHRSNAENPAWDGRISDKIAPEGTYRYKLVFTLPDGKVKTQVGTFVLLK